MSTPPPKISAKALSDPHDESDPKGLEAEPEQPFDVTPLFGALLRVTHEALTFGILDALRKDGIEMTETEFSVMRYPGPNGVRPIELARRCNMTKQAINYVLAGLEEKGYIERKSPPGSRHTTIYLTPKGWRLQAKTRHCATDIERLWAAHIGTRRFDALRASLHEIAVWLGRLPDSPAAHEASASASASASNSDRMMRTGRQAAKPSASSRRTRGENRATRTRTNLAVKK